MKSVRMCQVVKGGRKCEKCIKAKQLCEWGESERSASTRGEGGKKRKEIINLEEEGGSESESSEDASPPQKVARSK